MHLNWSKLKNFYLVAQAGSFKKAAAQHHKTSSAMSAMIKSFESELGMKLFVREETGLCLTKEGAQLYETAARMFHIAKAEEELLLKDKSLPGGHIKACAPAGILTRYIGTFIDEFMLGNPKIQLEFLPSNEMSQQERLSGEVLMNTYIPKLSGYHQEHLIDLDLRLYASKSYLKEFGEPKEVADLDHHRLISFVSNRHYPVDLNWHLLIGRTLDDMRTPFLEIDESFGRCRICSKGAGIISVPQQHPELKLYDLVEVLPHIKGPTTTYYLIVDEHLYRYEKIQLFATFLKKKFAQLQEQATA